MYWAPAEEGCPYNIVVLVVLAVLVVVVVVVVILPVVVMKKEKIYDTCSQPDMTYRLTADRQTDRQTDGSRRAVLFEPDCCAIITESCLYEPTRVNEYLQVLLYAPPL